MVSDDCGMRFEITDQIRRHLAEDEIAWLTSVSPKGRPSPHKVWFAWDGTAIAIYSLDDGARPRHIAANDQVGMHFNASARTAPTSWSSAAGPRSCRTHRRRPAIRVCWTGTPPRWNASARRRSGATRTTASRCG